METWFITGTSSGIGRLLTEELLDRGDRVAATLRAPEKLADLKARHGERLWLSRLDVRVASDVRSTVARAFSELGHIDYVVNNAGFGLFGAAEELADEQIEDIVATNLFGSMHVARAALPFLRAQKHGRIVQISSEGGQTTYPAFAAYHATKWGIEGFIEALASEVASFDVRCTIVEFGPTATNFGASLAHATPLHAYEATAVGDMRRGLAAGTAFTTRADPRDVVREIIERLCAGGSPLRIVVGTYAYERVVAALEGRLAQIRSGAGLR